MKIRTLCDITTKNNYKKFNYEPFPKILCQIKSITKGGGVAQLVARLLTVPRVEGSNPGEGDELINSHVSLGLVLTACYMVRKVLW